MCLKERDILSADEVDVLQNLVVTHDPVVMAAYVVAEEDSDAEYVRV